MTHDNSGQIKDILVESKFHYWHNQIKLIATWNRAVCAPTFILVILASTLFFPVSNSHAVRCINILRYNQPNVYKKPEECSKCHDAIFRSWKRSRHAISWTNDTFIAASDHRSKDKCFPCHIPAEIKPGLKPEARSENKEEGIYCVPCHASKASLDSEIDLFAPVPSTESDINFRDPTFCGSCHMKTLAEWKQTGVEKNCQTCHMMSDKKPVDHSFRFTEFGEEDLILGASKTDNAITIRLKNQTIPHLFPTSENGDPRLYLYIRLYNQNGEEIESHKETISPQQETALGYQKEISFEYEWTEETRRVEISLEYKPAWSKEKKVLRTYSL